MTTTMPMHPPRRAFIAGGALTLVSALAVALKEVTPIDLQQIYSLLHFLWLPQLAVLVLTILVWPRTAVAVGSGIGLSTYLILFEVWVLHLRDHIDMVWVNYWLILLCVLVASLVVGFWFRNKREIPAMRVALIAFATVAISALAIHGIWFGDGYAMEWQSTAAPVSAAPVKQGKTVSAELLGYNHTDKTIAAFYVNGHGGGSIWPGSGSGFSCCVDLPRPWHEGYTVTVTWEDHEFKMQKREILIPKYDATRAGGLNLHFLRSGEIKAFAGMTILGHPDYPLKGEEAKMPPGTLERRAAAAAASRVAGPPDAKELLEFLRDAIPIELKQVPESTLVPFVAKYQKAAMDAGLISEGDQTQYLIVALYTSGKGIEHPAFKAYLKSYLLKPPGSGFSPAQNVPEEVWHTGPSLWDAVQNTSGKKLSR